MAADDVTTAGRLEGDFGPNVGLVEEIYRQWLEDPASVAESWQDFFADYTPRLPSSQGRGAPAQAAADTGAVPSNGGAAPAAPSAPAAPAAPATPAAPAAPAPAASVPSPDAPPAAPAQAAPAAGSAPAAPAPASAPAPAAPADGAAPAPLRGAAALIVKNMEASLSVPTATSARVIPAGLLEVNRRVANNYLVR
ncbi:MAG TPA: multifunctional oxoglutarate decarboxylase/oxoglutarate dehydrogenase thiamine pyrophosphate-binding subunit/dihydrolipoyllysine-residue succinyltransferase subunit, partial [Acidimicrobiia bacterium]|nr:multifunctional oxoglutarate decarboxylase/oxoglutarate dehydrogenase thiamine pyrophosphate-binding subunit/dihydrolipoyllysine-residue succinyltransferase subunit [Acidimicrobiia bacterium]